MGTGGPFPGGKARPRRDADHSLSSSAEFKYTSSPPCASMACSGTALLLDLTVVSAVCTYFTYVFTVYFRKLIDLKSILYIYILYIYIYICYILP
jgi:hypothetical protein